jgi:predicted Rossmann fold flavoprotein
LLEKSGLDYDVIVLGAGAAGLFCAALAGQLGRRVLLIEHSARAGSKILISGGGRCNFTNRVVKPEHFLSANPHFAKSALARFTPQDFLTLVRKHRVSFHEKTLGQLFCDDSARQVLALLEDECRAGQIDLKLSCRVTRVSRDTRFCLETTAGAFTAPALVVATGGLSIPKMGATGFGYDLARQFGLAVESPYPALVPLTFEAAWRARWCDLAGVATEITAATGNTRFRERMLITHRGLSGPAILQISSYWRPPAPIRLDLLPGAGLAEATPATARRVVLDALPRRFAERWLDQEGFTNRCCPSQNSRRACITGASIPPVRRASTRPR